MLRVLVSAKMLFPEARNFVASRVGGGGVLHPCLDGRGKGASSLKDPLYKDDDGVSFCLGQTE